MYLQARVERNSLRSAIAPVLLLLDIRVSSVAIIQFKLSEQSISGHSNDRFVFVFPAANVIKTIIRAFIALLRLTMIVQEFLREFCVHINLS
jgi:hypothetical protein